MFDRETPSSIPRHCHKKARLEAIKLSFSPLLFRILLIFLDIGAPYSYISSSPNKVIVRHEYKILIHLPNLLPHLFF
jgi:hypothetical protein